MFAHSQKPTQPPEARFVLLHHAMDAAAGRFDHWDLMFEHGETLVTFELERLPAVLGQFETRRLADHRLTYLDFEGDVSGNRGAVIRLDRGPFQEIQSDDQTRGERRFRYQLQGQRLAATVSSNQPIYLLPFAQLIHLEAVQWDWHD